jgi:hypothetical protein
MAVLLNVHPAAVGVMRYQHEKATHDVMLYRHDRYRPSDYQVLTTTGLCDVSTTRRLENGLKNRIQRCRKQEAFDFPLCCAAVLGSTYHVMG